MPTSRWLPGCSQTAGGGNPGGGGRRRRRVAVFAGDASGFPLASLHALGGAGGTNAGAPGTVHVGP